MKNVLIYFFNLYTSTRFRDFLRKEFWNCLIGGIYFGWFIITSEKFDNPNIGLHATGLTSVLVCIGGVIATIFAVNILIIFIGYIYGLITQKKLSKGE